MAAGEGNWAHGIDACNEQRATHHQNHQQLNVTKCIATISFHRWFPMRETHSRHHSLIERTRCGARPHRTSYRSHTRLCALVARKRLGSTTSCLPGFARHNGDAQGTSEDRVIIRQKPQAIQQANLTRQNTEFPGQKSTKLLRSRGTGFPPRYAVQCERAPR